MPLTLLFVAVLSRADPERAGGSTTRAPPTQPSEWTDQMALVNCRECNAEISDSAATCPRCGVAAPAGEGTLTFVRPSLSGAVITVGVHVDGQPYGNLRARGRVTVPVAPGDHHIELTSSRAKSTVGSVRTGTGDTEVSVSFNIFGSPKLRIRDTVDNA